MKTLPNASEFSHVKKIFLPHPNVGLYIYSAPLEEEVIESGNISNIYDIPSQTQFQNKKKSNIIKGLLLMKKTQNILYLIFKKAFFPQMLSFCLLFIILKIENEFQIDCFEDNQLYYDIRDTLLYTILEIWIINLLLFQKSNTLVIFIIDSVCILMNLFIEYFETSQLNFGQLELDLYIFPFLFQSLGYTIIKILTKKIGINEMLKIFLAIGIFIVVLIDHFFFRQYLLELVYTSLKEYERHKIIFQCFLFVFYQTYGIIFIWILTKAYNKISANLLILLVKYHTINVLCSCIILPVILMEDRFTQIFGIFNFSVQLLSLYLQENLFVHYIMKIRTFFKNSKDHKKNRKNFGLKIKSIIAGSTNEVVYSITFSIINVLIFNKTIGLAIYSFDTDDNPFLCKLNFENFISFNPENLCLIFAINLFYFLYLVTEILDKRKVKFLWKLESYWFPIKIYHFILFQVYVDDNFQYFLYLSLLKKEE